MDVEAFFASIPHALLLDTIARMIKDRPLLRLIERVIESSGDGNGRGLPIGNLTSQWFANLTLGRLDRLVVEQLRIPGYARYMDDFVVFSDSRSLPPATACPSSVFSSSRQSGACALPIESE
jgi:RNA-directed DNA polymerase